VSAAGTSNLLMTSPFARTQLSKLSGLPGVSAARVYRGGLLDYNDRRIWVIAPPHEASPLVPPTQLVEGNVAQADAHVREGGWAVVSLALAEEHNLTIGKPFTLPTPNPTTFKVAAISTNIGWAPGAIIMNSDDYSKAWGSTDASAYNVLMKPGVSPEQGVREVTAALGSQSALTAQTSEQHADKLREITRQGLTRLSQIATLILVAAVMAMAAAMGAMIWQRRPRLAKLKLEGFPHRELWYTIVLESLMLLGVGCFSGAVFGLFGQQLLDRALNIVINYPVVSSVGVVVALSSLALVTASAVLMVAIPGWFAARVQASLALQD
jgi:putative ABC transport system permease protein